MSTEFNYVARLDTSQIMSGLSEIRSQVGMALGTGGMSQTNFGGAMAGLGQMSSAQAGGGMFGNTFTDPAIANSPHYGMQSAVTTLAQERLIQGPGGMTLAGQMAPPGVSAGEFAFAAMGNNIDREIQAREAGGQAGTSALMSNLGGAAAGWAAMKAVPPLMALAGIPLAGPIGMAASFLAYDMAGERITDHYAKVTQGLAETRELGDIVGSGRNLSPVAKSELGLAARSAAKDLGMDLNVFGDIMALSRDAGMLPSSTDPTKFKQQGMEYAAAVKEVTETLHTSLASATEIIKNAAIKGMSIREAMIQASTEGGNGMGSMMYSMGAGVGRSMGFTGAQGGTLFAGALGQAAGSGISGEEMKILGGQAGVASLIGGTQLLAAASPLGAAQLMAAQGGQALGGMMDLPGQAMAAMSGDGDMASNMLRFNIHQDEYRRGIGAKGVRTMALQQLNSMADMIGEFAPDLSRNDLLSASAMSLHNMTGTQAEAYVGGLLRPPGGDGKSAAHARALAIMDIADKSQDAEIGAAMDRMPKPKPDHEWGLTGAATGALFGVKYGWSGAVLGAIGGFAIENANGIFSGIRGIVDELSYGDLFSDPETKIASRERSAALQAETKMNSVRRQAGFMDMDPEYGARFMTADFRGASLNLLGGNSRAVAMAGTSLMLAGLTPGASGPGQMSMNGGPGYDIGRIQKFLKRKDKLLTQGERDDIARANYDLSDDEDAADIDRSIQKKINIISDSQADTESPDYKAAALGLTDQVRGLVMKVSDPKQKAMLLKSIDAGELLGGSDTSAISNLLAKRGIGGISPGGQNRIARAAAAATKSEVKTRADQFGAMALTQAVGEDEGYARTHAAFTAVAEIFPGLHSVRTDLESRIGANSHTKRSQELAVKGDYAKSTAELKLAIMEATEGDSAGRALIKNLDNVDVKKAIAMSGGGTTDLAQEAKLHHKSTGPVEKRSGAPAATIQSRTIGFGEQESAMASINKSLQRTHDMIKALYDNNKKPK